jgi:hypothetical protein
MQRSVCCNFVVLGFLSRRDEGSVALFVLDHVFGFLNQALHSFAFSSLGVFVEHFKDLLQTLDLGLGLLLMGLQSLS